MADVSRAPSINVLVEVQLSDARPGRASSLRELHDDPFVSSGRSRRRRTTAESEVELDVLGGSKVKVGGHQLPRARLQRFVTSGSFSRRHLRFRIR